MNELMKKLDRAYTLISEIPVNGKYTKNMAMALQALEDAYKELKSKNADTGVEKNG